MGAPRDHELYDIRRIMAILTAMPAAQRRRVWAYVNDRIELLPPHVPPRVAADPEDDLLETT